MKFRGNIAVKTVAFFLAVVLLLSTVFFGVCIVAGGVLGVYTDKFEEKESEIIKGILGTYADDVALSYLLDKDIRKEYKDSNFFYEIEASNGDHIVSKSNLPKNLPSVTITKNRYTHDDGTCTYIDYGGIFGAQFENSYDDFDLDDYPETIVVTLYEKPAKTQSDWLSFVCFWLDAVYNMRTLSIILASSSIVLLIIVWIFLFCSAGYRKKSMEPSLGFVDRIPFDLFTVLCAALFTGISAAGIRLVELVMYNHVGDISTQLTFFFAVGIGIVVCVVMLYLIVLGYLLSFATRVKVGGLVRGTLIYKTIAFVCKIIYKLVSSIPLVWKTHLVLFAISFVELFFLVINRYEPDNLLFLWLAGKLIMIPLIIWAALMLRKLKKGGEAIAAGRISEKVDTRLMPLDFGDFGKTLNNIGNGLERAVDEKMKSERLKTELITNVSHDIKTPLTSIVNYVDLIKKEDIDNEKVREYVDVLDRHSARLKKLIDDLVEASKASTGNLSVELEKCDIGVLLEQSLGEYSERLVEKEIVPVVSQPEEPVYIMADGRRLWRVFDNLLCNICKYAMPKTRAYIILEHKENSAVITLKNISRDSLGFSGDDLMERFVRGDSSRNTEGS
ncbi:MAG: HAMP domain-containing histidine kinase, partial [Clostridia bacterium]|nr:HAMP domain-containing histidine kinase [Clostridia bacterium]